MKQLRIVLLFISALLLCLHSEAHDDFEFNGVNYRLCDDGNSLIVCKKESGYKGHVIVPDSVFHDGKNYPVTAISTYAFADCDELKTVSFECKIKEIPQNCFERSHNLETIELPEGIEYIRYEAFKNSGLKDINLPEGILEIEGHAFDGTNIEHIVLPGTLKGSGLGHWNFYRCPQLQSLAIPGSIIRLYIYTIRDCKRLKHIKLGEGLVFLDDTFYECDSLESLEIPSTVREIGESWYSYRIKHISVDSDNKWYDSRNDCNALIEKATNTLVLGCINTVIPENVTSIGAAFRNCEGLKTAYIPANIESLHSNAFGYNRLDSIIIQESNESIQFTNGTFNSNSHTEKGSDSTAKYLYLGRNVSSRGIPAFEEFPYLETLIIGNHVDSLIMKGCNKYVNIHSQSQAPHPFIFMFGNDTEAVLGHATLHVPKGTRELYMATEGWKLFQTIIEDMPSAISTSYIHNRSDDSVFNLQGQRIESTFRRGIYIQNGRKKVAK